jgi:hypothetical protein
MTVPGFDPGIVPVIHAAPPQKLSSVSRRLTAWMPGTSPGMTAVGRYLSAHGIESGDGHDDDGVEMRPASILRWLGGGELVIFDRQIG